MTRQAGRALTIWLLAMLAGAIVVWNSHFSADMSHGEAAGQADGRAS